MYSFLADLLLIIHFAYVIFVVGGLAIIWAGYFFHWDFVRNFWFRLAHLLAIAYVVEESLTNTACPLTVWENEFRLKAGSGVYQGSFIEHWIHPVMFYDGTSMTFTIIYSLFFTAVLLSLWLVKPKWMKK